jgi:hypothetical protein
VAEDRDRAFVKNAADPRQVKDAGRKAKRAREEELQDLAALLGTEPGRRVLWRVLSYCGLFGEVFAADSHLMAFNAGVRNVGLFLHAEISAADEMAFFLMMKEARDRQTKQGDEAQAAHTPSADQQGEGSEPDL